MIIFAKAITSSTTGVRSGLPRTGYFRGKTLNQEESSGHRDFNRGKILANAAEGSPSKLLGDLWGYRDETDLLSGRATWRPLTGSTYAFRLHARVMPRFGDGDNSSVAPSDSSSGLSPAALNGTELFTFSPTGFAPLIGCMATAKPHVRVPRIRVPMPQCFNRPVNQIGAG